MVRQLVILLTVALAVAQAASTAERTAVCEYGGFELKQGESVVTINREGLCGRCRCTEAPEASRVACDEPEPCEEFGAQPERPEPQPVVAADADLPVMQAKVRRARASKLSCEHKSCVKGCIMRNGAPECIH